MTVVVDALTGATKTVPIGQSCASCHFNAGADSRTKNQLNPGFRAIPPDTLFTAPFAVGYQLRVNDFPFHRLSDPNNVDSSVLFDTNDVASSEGTFRKHFLDIQFNNPTDLGSREDSIFNVKGEREVEPRNTPTMINAVFNFRNFWDGRARNEFNGVNPIGDLDPYARVLLSCVDNATGAQLKGSNDPKGKCKLHDGDLQAVAMTANMRLENSSLASQAVGPTLSDLEMSFNGRTFPKLGKKMLSLTKALPNQLVRADDSVLGPYASPADPVTFLPTTGLTVNYSYLIQRAFDQRFWDSPILIQIPGGTNADGTTKLTLITSGSPTTDTNTFTEMEYNFSLFWGLAIQAYEATLRADDSRLDQFFDGNSSALTAQEKLGLDVFTNKGRCVNCHGGAETTNASVSNVVNTEKLERMIMGDDNVAVYDNGFYNTAVNRCAGLAGPCDDVGLGATIGPKNLPLSMSRFFQLPNNCKFGTTTIGGISLTGCTGAPPSRAGLAASPPKANGALRAPSKVRAAKPTVVCRMNPRRARGLFICLVVFSGTGFSVNMRSYLHSTGKAVGLEDLEAWLRLFFGLDSRA